MFGWYDKNANRNGGHWVTVTGTYENGNTKGIYIKDDGKQGEDGGTSESYHGWHTDGDWGRLTGYDGANNYCWVESVVSESYDKNVTFDIFPASIILVVVTGFYMSRTVESEGSFPAFPHTNNRRSRCLCICHGRCACQYGTGKDKSH